MVPHCAFCNSSKRNSKASLHSTLDTKNGEGATGLHRSLVRLTKYAKKHNWARQREEFTSQAKTTVIDDQVTSMKSQVSMLARFTPQRVVPTATIKSVLLNHRGSGKRLLRATRIELTHGRSLSTENKHCPNNPESCPELIRMRSKSSDKVRELEMRVVDSQSSVPTKAVSDPFTSAKPKFLRHANITPPELMEKATRFACASVKQLIANHEKVMVVFDHTTKPSHAVRNFLQVTLDDDTVELSNIEYRISNIEYRISNIEYRVSNIEYRIWNIEYGVSNIEYRISNIEYRISNIEYRISNIEYRISNIEYRTSNIEYRISNIEYRISNIEYRISNIEYRISNIEYRISNIEYRISNIEYRTSNIEHRISNIEYRISNIEY
eukprot:g45861.t1